VDQARDTERFYDLVWPYRADVLRLAQFLSHAHAEAEDLAQETLLKAFTKIGSFKGGSDAKGWLLTILRNTWVDRVRAKKTHPEMSLDDLPAEQAAAQAEPLYESSQPEELLNGFSDQEIIDALRRLPEDIRWTLLLVDVQELAQQEAAGILDIPLGTVKSRVHRGHAMVRDLLMPLARDRRFVRE
jgi:RNA polymerase sigma-70 factor (ECF subfamily)